MTNPDNGQAMHELEVASLGVMHAGYRLDPESMHTLLADVKNGAVFDQASLEARDPLRTGLVALTRFEDGRLAIRDGLHRATAIMRMRPLQTLHPEEYLIEDMSYDMFLRPNLPAEFYTPFDPRHEVRIADWNAFRQEVQLRLATSVDPLPFIESQRKIYTRPREAQHESLEAFYRDWSLRTATKS